MNKETAEKKACPIKGGTCLTDACMMWKWEYHYDFHANWRRPPIITISKTEGYCGLIKDE